jgi:hypothetical protein
VKERVPLLLAVTAGALRLIPLHWLHPVNWDEIEFFRATKWIAEGRLPFRDFWEHHSPLPWFLFAPVAAFVDSIDTTAIVAMRWAQVPVWVVVFVLANLFMRNAGLSPFARWSALAIGASSSLLMTSAVEYRVDPVAIALYLGGLVAWQRDTKRSMILSGVLFFLTGFSNLRLVPLLAVTVLLLWFVDRRERAWRPNRRAGWIYAGGVAALAAAMLFFAATGSWGAMFQQLVRDNITGERTAPEIESMFANRALAPFGLHIIIYDDPFEPGAIDAGGILVEVAGLVGLILALLRMRRPDDLFVMAVLQLVNIVTIAGMKFVFNYHFQTAVVLMLPLLALVFERIPRRGVVVALLLVAWGVNAYASILRGKEDDRAYQDLIMREADARTKPKETVWAGIPWALRREPAYRFWFLPELTRQLVLNRDAPPYTLRQIVANPPAAVVADRNTLVWLVRVQKELGPYFVRHYVPVWRSLWIPGMNGRVSPQRPRYQWLVPRDGEYRLYVSAEAARHPWFTRPMYISAYDFHGVELTLPPPGSHPELRWWIDGRPVALPPRLVLRKGQRIALESTSAQPLAVFLVNSDDRVLFRQPAPNVTLEASAPRVTHWPKLR